MWEKNNIFRKRELVKVNPNVKKWTNLLYYMKSIAKKIRILSITNYALNGLPIETFSFNELGEWDYIIPNFDGRSSFEEVWIGIR